MDDCVPSREVAEAPPQPTVWLQMEEDCGASAFSMPSLTRQMEEIGARYLMITPDPKYPTIHQWVPYLEESGAFEVAHVSAEPQNQRNGMLGDLVLLRLTGQKPRPVPTRMDPTTVLALVNCERKESGRLVRENIRAAFPNGIAIEPRPVPGRREENELKRQEMALEKIRRIYEGAP